MIKRNSKSLEEVLCIAKDLTNVLFLKKQQLRDKTKDYETQKTFMDEFNRAILTLEGLESELENMESVVKSTSVFLPQNLPIYSFMVLFLVL